MASNIDFEKGFFGTRAVIKSSWQENYLRALLDRGVVELELNIGKGWSGDNICFIESLSNLKSLTILDQSIKSIQSIHKLGELQQLNISTYCKTPIDFNCFPGLEECAFEWRNGSDSLFECRNLKRLSINRYNNNSSSLFHKLTSLESLTILNSLIYDLQGLSSLSKLIYLCLGNLKNIKNLTDLSNLMQLNELTIQRCKGINSIAEIFNLVNLRRLMLIDIGNIESLKGIERLSKLEDFLFYESTNIIDGDLLPLFELTKLKKVSFQNRKHYSNRREEFLKL